MISSGISCWTHHRFIARIASFREVRFETMGINFLIVMNPAALAGAPHTHIATVYAAPEAEAPLLRSVAGAYPNVTAVRVRDAIDRVAEALDGIGAATRSAAAATLVTGFMVLVGAAPRAIAEDAATVENRLRSAVEYLSSDDREGRGIGTKGLDQAADYIANEFRQLGLKTDVVDGGPFQKFTMTTGATLGDSNQLALVGPPAEQGGQPPRIELKLGEDYNPLAIGGSGKFDLPLAFVGYGITSKQADYDDYAGIDADGKAVIVLRHEPQQDNPHSAFDGTKNSNHAPYTRKLSNAVCAQRSSW